MAEATNSDRSYWGLAAAREMQSQTGCDSCDAISDTIGNLLHLATACGYDADKIVAKATAMFKEEVKIDKAGNPNPDVIDFAKEIAEQYAEFDEAVKQSANAVKM